MVAIRPCSGFRYPAVDAQRIWQAGATPAQYLRVLSRVRLLFEVGHAAEDLKGHPEIAVRAEVCNPDAFELAAQDHINASFGLHCQHFVEALGSDGVWCTP